MSRSLSKMPPVASRYSARKRLGAGAFGEVYLCHDSELDRPVALKVLHLRGVAGSRGEEVRARFQVEARVAARLAHPGLVALYDHGVLPDGRAYLVWEYVEGRSLEDVLEEEAPLEPARAVAWVRELADALEHAHGHGVLHRDLKPANILVRDGHLVLCDFGMARDEASVEQLTATGAVLGTPRYLAPEMMRGGAEVGPGLDVWGLAAIAYEMLYGRPYRRGPEDLLKDSKDYGPPNAVRLGRYPGLDDALGSGLHGDPDQRAPGAGAFAAALEEALGDPGAGGAEVPEAPEASSLVPAPPVPGDAPRRGAPWFALAIAFGVGVGLVAPEAPPAVPPPGPSLESEPRWDPAPLATARDELWSERPKIDGLEAGAVQRAPVLIRLGQIDRFQVFLDRLAETLETLDHGEVPVPEEALSAAAFALMEHAQRINKTDEHVRGGLLSATLDGKDPGFSLPEWERALTEYQELAGVFVRRAEALQGSQARDAKVAACVAIAPVLAPGGFLRLAMEAGRHLPAASGDLAKVTAEAWSWAVRWDEWGKSGLEDAPGDRLVKALLDALEQSGGRWPRDDLTTVARVAHGLAVISRTDEVSPDLRQRALRACLVLEEQVWVGRGRAPEALRWLHANLRNDLPEAPAKGQEIRQLLDRRAAAAR